MRKYSIIISMSIIAGLAIAFIGYILKEYHEMKNIGFFNDWNGMDVD